MKRKRRSADPENPRRQWPGSARATQFGCLLAILRAERQLERRSLAQRAGVSYQTLASIEQGVRWPTDNALGALAVGLDLKLDDLVQIRDRLANESAAQTEGGMGDWLEQTARFLGRSTKRADEQSRDARSDLEWIGPGGVIVHVQVYTTRDRTLGVLTRVAPYEPSPRMHEDTRSLFPGAASARIASISRLLEGLPEDNLARAEDYIRLLSHAHSTEVPKRSRTTHN